MKNIFGRFINNFGLNSAKQKIAAGGSLAEIRPVDGSNSTETGFSEC